MLNLLDSSSGFVMKNMRLDYQAKNKSMHITFDIRSNANCYRETENKNTWIINLWTNQAEGVKICPFVNMDWQSLHTDLQKRANLEENTIRELLYALRRFKT